MALRFEESDIKRILLQREMQKGCSLQQAQENLKSGKYADLFRDKPASGKQPKYHNQITWIDGFCFRSRKEADYYIYLKQLHQVGEIAGFGVQSPKFILVTGDGKDNRAVSWTADFIVFNIDGSYEIVDTKGKETKEFQRVMKMMKEKYPKITVRIVK
jgi:allantoicase